MSLLLSVKAHVAQLHKQDGDACKSSLLVYHSQIILCVKSTLQVSIFAVLVR